LSQLKVTAEGSEKLVAEVKDSLGTHRSKLLQSNI
jgi:hypothetical protein